MKMPVICSQSHLSTLGHARRQANETAPDATGYDDNRFRRPAAAPEDRAVPGWLYAIGRLLQPNAGHHAPSNSENTRAAMPVRLDAIRRIMPGPVMTFSELARKYPDDIPLWMFDRDRSADEIDELMQLGLAAACNCGAATAGKWAGIHSPDCAALSRQRRGEENEDRRHYGPPKGDRGCSCRSVRTGNE